MCATCAITGAIQLVAHWKGHSRCKLPSFNSHIFQHNCHRGSKSGCSHATAKGCNTYKSTNLMFSMLQAPTPCWRCWPHQPWSLPCWLTSINDVCFSNVRGIMRAHSRQFFNILSNNSVAIAFDHWQQWALPPISNGFKLNGMAHLPICPSFSSLAMAAKRA